MSVVWLVAGEPQVRQEPCLYGAYSNSKMTIPSWPIFKPTLLFWKGREHWLQAQEQQSRITPTGEQRLGWPISELQHGFIPTWAKTNIQIKNSDKVQWLLGDPLTLEVVFMSSARMPYFFRSLGGKGDRHKLRSQSAISLRLRKRTYYLIKLCLWEDKSKTFWIAQYSLWLQNIRSTIISNVNTARNFGRSDLRTSSWSRNNLFGAQNVG